MKYVSHSFLFAALCLPLIGCGPSGGPAKFDPEAAGAMTAEEIQEQEDYEKFLEEEAARNAAENE